MADDSQIVSWTQIKFETDENWERAYRAFETPQEEIAKFKKRLKSLGVDGWSRSASVVELFCGRGNGCLTLETYCFTSIEGVDLSEPLLKDFSGSAKLYVGDCRDLKFVDRSKDIVIVQGGLHHLPVIPNDLEKVLLEVERILVPGGQFIFVEPWHTPFLALVHFVLLFPIFTKNFKKLNALKVMIDCEKDTYFNWLDNKKIILSLLEEHFINVDFKARFGKLYCIARTCLD